MEEVSRGVLLDAFSGDGGAGRGYRQAGWYVIGVDIAPQPHYGGHEFIQADALEVLADRVFMSQFDAAHTSPPCQKYCTLAAYQRHIEYPDLVDPVRELLIATGLPYVIENVPQAPLRDPVTLCGGMFGLPVYRHRGFESNVPLSAPDHPTHTARCVRNGYLPTAARPFMSIHGGRHSRAWLLAAASAMGVEWMVDSDTAESIRRVCEAIPPAYTHHLGGQLLAHAMGSSLPVR
jgi:DNA (cytosine-5)-methyltransferase 1